MGAARTNRVARAPALRHVDDVVGSGHDGPTFRADWNNLQDSAGDVETAPAHVEDRVFLGQSDDRIPSAPPDPVIPAATHSSPQGRLR